MFKAYADPGHAWVAVKVKLLQDLGIADKITRFSYLKGKTAYLEEDCDVSKFVAAYTAKFGQKPTFTEKFTNKSSPIRSYPSYQQPTI
jgi:hypothetical protein